MANSNLNVTELDFSTIKENLKNYLKSQSEFQDYDFEASGLNVLLDVLAYNTHYNAYYLNMALKESFLDSALLRNSIVSHAKSLGYTPKSKKASFAVINLEFQATNNEPSSLTLPRGFSFSSNQIDDVSYEFLLLDDVTATKADGTFVFENLKIYEGVIGNYQYTYNIQTNPKQIFTISDSNVDTDTIKVYVTESSTNPTTTVYNLAEDILDIDSNSPVYFLQESKEGNYQIFFGNGSLGKALTDGNIVTISYLSTNSSLANKANDFVVSATSVRDSRNDELIRSTITVVQSSTGGLERESIDSIKFYAPLHYASQNRLITNKDYEKYLMQNYPGLEAVSVWGGNEESPPIFGKIFISLKTKDNYYISETEKRRIVEEILKPKSVISIESIIRDPEFVFVKIFNTIKYDPQKNLLTTETFKNNVRTLVLNFFESNVNNFNKTFVLSKLQEEMNKIDPSIIGVDSVLRLEKRFLPQLNVSTNYKIQFNQSLLQGNILNRLISDEFDVFDSFGIRRTVQIEEVLDSFSGIYNILVLNPGSGYVTEPTVTITGDGSGATARAKIVNGRIESIRITSPGENYTKATVTISGGGGFGASAVSIINNKFGILRLIYFNENTERQIVDPEVGTIDYDTGEINLFNLNILSTYSTDNFIKLDVGAGNTIIESNKNTIITIDPNDPSSISTTLVT
jgi:hypothetical protein